MATRTCMVCGGAFMPESRVGSKQKVCGQEICRKERKRRADARWRATNLGYRDQNKMRRWAAHYPRYWRASRAGPTRTTWNAIVSKPVSACRPRVFCLQSKTRYARIPSDIWNPSAPRLCLQSKTRSAPVSTTWSRSWRPGSCLQNQRIWRPPPPPWHHLVHGRAIVG
jgi:predicted nucleic acid-binding Zn ribbon protein